VKLLSSCGYNSVESQLDSILELSNLVQERLFLFNVK